jgi:hypothetical protein
MLEGKEQTLGRAQLRREREQVDAVERDRSRGRVALAPGEDYVIDPVVE